MTGYNYYVNYLNLNYYEYSEIPLQKIVSGFWAQSSASVHETHPIIFAALQQTFLLTLIGSRKKNIRQH